MYHFFSSQQLFQEQIEVSAGIFWAKYQAVRTSEHDHLNLCGLPDAIFMDMDGTTVKEETLNEIGFASGKDFSSVTELAMNGALGFEESLRQRLSFLKGISKKLVLEGVANMTLQPHVEQLKGIGIPKFLVTGGFTEFCDALVEKIGFKEYRANRFEYEKGCLTGSFVSPVVDAQAKAEFLDEICMKNNFLCPLAIGDGANDIKMFQKAKVAVGFSPKPVLEEYISGRVSDYRLLVGALQYLKGITS